MAKRTITLTDLKLAEAYFPLLVACARENKTISYGELVDSAKAAYPESEHVQQAIAVSTGRRLELLREFTNERGLPDLSSLVVNKGSQECGTGFSNAFDPKKIRDTVYAFDWESVSTDFDYHLDVVEKSLAPRKRRSRTDAKKLMFEHYQNNKATLPPTVKLVRELIIELLVDGVSVDDAFAEAVNDL